MLVGLKELGIRIVLLRCACYNKTDLVAAQELGIVVAHMPTYSQEAIAEHTLALIMTLSRHTHGGFNRVREGNFSLDGLLGQNLHCKTVSLISTGKIELTTARIK